MGTTYDPYDATKEEHLAANRYGSKWFDRLVAINESISKLSYEPGGVAATYNFRIMKRKFHNTIHEMANALPALVKTVESL